MATTPIPRAPVPATRAFRRLGVRRTVTALLAVVTAVALSGCLLNEPTDPAPLRFRDEVFTAVTKVSDVTYGAATRQNGDPVTLKFDLYQPAGDTMAARPLIIWIHGGSFAGGNKTSPEIVDQANAFARKGYVNASISYRLANPGCTVIGESCINAIVDAAEDAQAAVRFLRAHAGDYDIDPGRIAVAGTSAGAITALNVGYRADLDETSGTPGVSSEVRAAVSLSGARLVGGCDQGDAPALLFHGTSDALVPYQWAVDTEACAEAAGVWVHLTSWAGEGHVPYSAHRDEIIDTETTFLFNALSVRALL